MSCVSFLQLVLPAGTVLLKPYDDNVPCVFVYGWIWVQLHLSMSGTINQAYRDVTVYSIQWLHTIEVMTGRGISEMLEFNISGMIVSTKWSTDDSVGSIPQNSQACGQLQRPTIAFASRCQVMSTITSLIYKFICARIVYSVQALVTRARIPLRQLDGCLKILPEPSK